MPSLPATYPVARYAQFASPRGSHSARRSRDRTRLPSRATAAFGTRCLGRGVRLTAGVHFGRGRTAATRGRIFRECNGPAADPRLGEHKLDAFRGFPVTGDVGHDGADLLVSGHHEERRRAAVGFHAREVEAGFG